MYLFDNELFAIECMAKYAMEGLNVNYRGIHNGRSDEFAHCPEPSSKGDWGYYLTFNDHQHQGLLQSKDMGYQCFHTGKVSNWLTPKHPNFFELYSIFKHYISGRHNSMHGRVGSLNPTSKAIYVIKPNGTKLYFGSVIEAAKELGIERGHLCTRYLKTGRSPRWGKFKDYQFFYAE